MTRFALRKAISSFFTLIILFMTSLKDDGFVLMLAGLQQLHWRLVHTARNDDSTVTIQPMTTSLLAILVYHALSVVENQLDNIKLKPDNFTFSAWNAIDMTLTLLALGQYLSDDELSGVPNLMPLLEITEALIFVYSPDAINMFCTERFVNYLVLHRTVESVLGKCPECGVQLIEKRGREICPGCSEAQDYAEAMIWGDSEFDY